MQIDSIKTLARTLRKLADDIEAGNTHLSTSEAIAIMDVFAHREVSKEIACQYLNISRSKFDTYVNQGKIPEGQKRVGFKELVWYLDELDKCKTKLK